MMALGTLQVVTQLVLFRFLVSDNAVIASWPGALVGVDLFVKRLVNSGCSVRAMGPSCFAIASGLFRMGPGPRVGLGF